MKALLVPIEPPPSWGTIPIKEIKDGKIIYTANSMWCHGGYPPIMSTESRMVPDNLPTAVPVQIDVTWYWVKKECIESPITDTDRLNFLLKYIDIDDVGEESPFPSVVVSTESLEEVLSFNPIKDNRGRSHVICTFKNTMRQVIDNAMLMQSNLNQIADEDMDNG